jgi:hydrogenase maturation protein HypF
VAPGNRHLGVMLPYTGLHHLLLRAVGVPVVLTSGNLSDEPIAHEDADALARLSGVADAFLLHDRAIATRVDDSVVRPLRGSVAPVRRSRGFAPAPVRLPVAARRHLLGCGAELKNTFAVAKDGRAFLSHHIGDLTTFEVLRAFRSGIDHLQQLFDVRPEVVAHDLHPDYLSTRYALDLDGVETVAVQHHHAHIASCLADNGETGPVVGVALDGLGYGTDGTLWGGEVLVADLLGFERAGHLEPVPQPGGDAATREPWRMAASYLQAAYGAHPPSGLAVAARNADRWEAVRSVAASGEHAPLTSSAGRLFDAVAALVGVRDRITYEGQAAVELEQAVEPSERGSYEAHVDGGVLRGTDLVRAVVEDLGHGTDVGRVAARFHRGLAAGVVELAGRVAASRGLETAALSGGVFQNVVLTDLVVAGLEARGLQVLTHHQVPPNDGGICLGQVAVAAARDRLT